MAAKPKPGTVDHFRQWAKELVLDTGDHWELEGFQLEIVDEVLGGRPIVWVVIPEGNTKTTLLAGLALYHCDAEGWNVQTPNVPIGASSREQAEIMYRQAEGFIFRTPRLRAPNKRADHGFVCQEGFRRILALATGGRIQVYAADDRTGDGVIPTLALVDELHRHKNLNLYRTWRGKLKKRKGQLVVISTAGEPASEFEDVRAAIIRDADTVEKSGLKDAHIRAESKRLVLHDYAVRDRADAEDMDIVAAANPFSLLTPEELGETKADPDISDEHWQRFNCNIATRVSGQAITVEEWDALQGEGEPDKSAWSIGWVDLGWVIDTTAVGLLVWESEESRWIADVKVIEPPVDEAEIVEAMIVRQALWTPVGWVFDPNAGAQQMMQLLDKGEHPQQEGIEVPLSDKHHFSQDNGPMALASGRFDEAVRNRWLKHDGSKDLRKHVQNAVKKPVGAGGEKWRYDRPPEARGERRKKYPNDALIGAVMGHSVAVAEHDQPEYARAAFGGGQVSARRTRA